MSPILAVSFTQGSGAHDSVARAGAGGMVRLTVLRHWGSIVFSACVRLWKDVEYHDVVSDSSKLDIMLKHSEGARRVPVIVDQEKVTIGFGGILANIPGAGMAYSAVENALHHADAAMLAEFARVLGVAAGDMRSLLAAYDASGAQTHLLLQQLAQDAGYGVEMLIVGGEACSGFGRARG